MKEVLLTTLKSIGVADIVDILIVAFLIYKILGYIRETGSQQIVKGILVLVAVFVMSDIFHLYTLHWILKGAMTIGVIALIILFQPELRHALEYLGRGKLIGGRFAKVDKSKAKKNTDVLVDAADELSAKWTGALIVIEGDISLSGIVKTGTVLDAELSAEMLCNIFYKGAPLHDGAVLIRDDRILAAGCVLPLSPNLNLDKDLGTRHRAGIGITENTDAVSLIVSEETGGISVAKGGEIRRFLDAKALEKFLLNLYLEPDPEDLGILDRLRKVMRGGQDAK